jgi:hypothetical protein
MEQDREMNTIIKKILKFSLTILLVVIYMNILAFLIPFFDLEYTMIEYISIIFVFVFAIVTSEFMFRRI